MLNLLIKLSRDKSGVSAVEFAIVLPVLVAVMYFSIEISLHFWTKNKIQNFVYQAADIISRDSDNEISISEIDEVFDNIDIVTADRLSGSATQKAVIMYAFDDDPACVNPFDPAEACAPIPRPVWYYNDGFGLVDPCDYDIVDNDEALKLGDINEGYMSNTPVIAVFYNLEYKPVISEKFGVSTDIYSYRFLTVRSGDVIEPDGAGFEKCT